MSINGNTSNLCLMTGNANPELAKKIADHVGVELVDTFVGRFNNGETQVMINRSIRGKDIFIVNPTCQLNGLADYGGRLQKGFGAFNYSGRALLRLRPAR